MRAAIAIATAGLVVGCAGLKGALDDFNRPTRPHVRVVQHRSVPCDYLGDPLPPEACQVPGSGGSHAVGAIRLGVEVCNCEMPLPPDPNPPPPPTRYSSAAGPLCPVWHRIYPIDLLGAEHREAARVMEWSPQTLWCLTTTDALNTQREEYEAACASGVVGSAEDVVTAWLVKCGAYPAQ